MKTVTAFRFTQPCTLNMVSKTLNAMQALSQIHQCNPQDPRLPCQVCGDHCFANKAFQAAQVNSDAVPCILQESKPLKSPLNRKGSKALSVAVQPSLFSVELFQWLDRLFGEKSSGRASSLQMIKASARTEIWVTAFVEKTLATFGTSTDAVLTNCVLCYFKGRRENREPLSRSNQSAEESIWNDEGIASVQSKYI